MDGPTMELCIHQSISQSNLPLLWTPLSHADA